MQTERGRQAAANPQTKPTDLHKF